MRKKPLDVNTLQVRQVKFLPQDLSTDKQFVSELLVEPNLKPTLSQLFGQTGTGGILIGATNYNALKVAVQGSALTSYSIKAGSQPSAFSSSHQLAATTGIFHRFDILVETQEAVIRFYCDATASWLSEIPLTKGNHSFDFESSICQIKYRTATGGTYQITGYQ